MRRTRILLIVVVGFVSVGLSANTLIDPIEVTDEFEVDGTQDDALAAEYTRRAVEIEAELAAGSSVEWAGKYHFGDGLGVNVTVVIAPDHGFAAIWTGCLGVYGRSFGSVTPAGDRLLLNHETPNYPGEFGHFSNVLIPVHRDEGLYLVGEEQMADFVDAAKSGSEMCPEHCAGFLIRDSDRDLVEVRIPELRAEMTERLLDEALFARVTRIIEPDLDAIDGESRWRKARVEIDAGHNRGLREGMEFYSTTAGWITDTITVDRVNDATAVATVSAYNMQPILLGSGTCVSTYYDDAIEKRVDGRPHDGCDVVDVAEQ